MSCIRGCFVSWFVMFYSLFVRFYLLSDFFAVWSAIIVPHESYSIQFYFISLILIWVTKLCFCFLSKKFPFSAEILLHFGDIVSYRWKCICSVSEFKYCLCFIFITGYKFPAYHCNPVCQTWITLFVCVWAYSQVQFHLQIYPRGRSILTFPDT